MASPHLHIEPPCASFKTPWGGITNGSMCVIFVLSAACLVIGSVAIPSAELALNGSCLSSALLRGWDPVLLDEDAASVVSLVQSSARMKVKRVKRAETVSSNSFGGQVDELSSAAAQEAAPATALMSTWDRLGCSARLLAPSVRFELESLQKLGLLEEQRHRCPGPDAMGFTDTQLALMQAPTTTKVYPEEMRQTQFALGRLGFGIDINRAALALIATWAVLALYKICDFTAAVASPSCEGRKDEGRLLPDKAPPRVSNERDAWKRGFWFWLSMSWLDQFVQKLAHGAPFLADARNVNAHCGDAIFEPHVRVREAWHTEVKERGLTKAKMANTLLRVIGIKHALLLLLCAWAAAFLEFVGMVVALDVVLSYLNMVEVRRAESHQFTVQALRPSVTILGLLFIMPMAHRGFSIITCMVDGHFTRIFSAGLGCLVYEKALRLPVGHGYHGNAGEGPSLAQLLSADVIQELTFLLKTLAQFSVAPVVLIILVTLLVARLRLAGLLGVGYLIPGLLLSMAAMRAAARHRRRYQDFQDTRLRLFTEMVQGIRAVKALSWEFVFNEKIQDVRESELGANQAYAMSVGAAVANTHSAIWFMALGSLFSYLVLFGTVEARHMWVVFQIMASLQACLNHTFLGLDRIARLPNTLLRLESFLKQPERPTDVVRAPAQAVGAPSVQVCGSFTFELGSEAVLHNLDLAFEQGELVAVVGGTGSGKSALAQAILGELFPVGLAHVVAPQRVAYGAQVPWVFEGSLRDNVLAGRQIEAMRYCEVMRAAALETDLTDLRLEGHSKLLGVSGAQLSASQRARASLARAAYTDSELVVLDEPFAALDVRTVEHVLQNMLLGESMRDRTRVVAMQPDPRLLTRFDRIVVLDEGRVVAQGPLGKVLESTMFQELVAAWGSPVESEAHGDSSLEVKVAKVAASLTGVTTTPLRSPVLPPTLPHLLPASEAESQSPDRLSSEAMGRWLCKGGRLQIIVLLLFVFAQRAAQLFESLGLARWGDNAARSGCDHRAYLTVIFVTVTVNACLLWTNEWLCSRVALQSSRALHDHILRRIQWASVDRFFDQQPTGRLLSKFSFDMMQVDSAMVSLSVQALRNVVGMLIQQLYVLSVVPRWVAVSLSPLYSAIVVFSFKYRAAVVSLTHCTRVSLSAAHELVGYTAGAQVSVRAGGACSLLLTRYSDAISSATKASYLSSAVCKSWFSLRVSLCICFQVTAFTLCALLLPSAGIGVGSLGLLISLSFAFLSDFESATDLFVQCTLAAGSLQRLSELQAVPLEEEEKAKAMNFGEAQDGPPPLLRKFVTICRSELLSGLSWRQDAGELLIITSESGAPILRAAADGHSLRPTHQNSLSNIASSCTALAGLGKEFHVVAVNGARGAEEMAEELCGVVQTLRVELLHSLCVNGVAVQFRSLCAGHGSGPDVLRGISVDVQPRSKVALVGPMCSGKSTLLLCACRLVQPRSGQVLLNAWDTGTFGLRALRSAVSFASPDPLVFRGSWRENLDPSSDYADDRLWGALQIAGLAAHVLSQPRGLDSQIVPDGAALRAGRRQLLSMARLVVRQPPVLLVDGGVTSVLDPAAQDIAHAAVVSGFPESTVLAVRHRPEACAGFDSVLALRDGVVIAHGSLRAGDSESVLAKAFTTSTR